MLISYLKNYLKDLHFGINTNRPTPIKEHHEYICIQECHQIIQVNDKVDHNEHRKQIDRNFSEVINPY